MNNGGPREREREELVAVESIVARVGSMLGLGQSYGGDGNRRGEKRDLEEERELQGEVEASREGWRATSRRETEGERERGHNVALGREIDLR